jgi:hypothetical protein
MLQIKNRAWQSDLKTQDPNMASIKDSLKVQERLAMQIVTESELRLLN